MSSIKLLRFPIFLLICVLQIAFMLTVVGNTISIGVADGANEFNCNQLMEDQKSIRRRHEPESLQQQKIPKNSEQDSSVKLELPTVEEMSAVASVQRGPDDGDSGNPSTSSEGGDKLLQVQDRKIGSNPSGVGVTKRQRGARTRLLTEDDAKFQLRAGILTQMKRSRRRKPKFVDTGGHHKTSAKMNNQKPASEDEHVNPKPAEPQGVQSEKRTLKGAGGPKIDEEQEDSLLHEIASLKETVEAVRPLSTADSVLQNKGQHKRSDRDKLQTAAGKLELGTEKHTQDEKAREGHQDTSLEKPQEKDGARKSKDQSKEGQAHQPEGERHSEGKVRKASGDNNSQHRRSDSQNQESNTLELDKESKGDMSELVTGHRERKNDHSGQDPRGNQDQLKHFFTVNDPVKSGSMMGDQLQQRRQDPSSKSSKVDNPHDTGSMRELPQTQTSTTKNTKDVQNHPMQTKEYHHPERHGDGQDRRSSHESDKGGSSSSFEQERHPEPKQRKEANSAPQEQKLEKEEMQGTIVVPEEQRREHREQQQQSTSKTTTVEPESVPDHEQLHGNLTESETKLAAEHEGEHEEPHQGGEDATPIGEETSQTPEEEKPFVFPEPYLLGPSIKDWDKQRDSWLKAHPHMRRTSDGKARVLIVTGSQPETCRSPIGDYFHVHSLKIKIDYARMHKYEMYYNFVWLDPLFGGYWVKLPTVRKLMLTHPEIEWIFWVDSDAIFTDMLFEAPFDKYDSEGVNMIMWGWDHGFFTRKSWVAFNAGVFILRNCQWSLDLIDKWSPMGPGGRVQEEYGKILTEFLSDRHENYPADDQSALAYLILTDEDVKSKVKLVDYSDYMVSGWWVEVVNTYENLTEKYHPGLGDRRWPWITHFTGCGPCNGDFGTDPYSECMKHVERALNFADNQVLAYMGFQHTNLSSPEVTRTRAETERPLDFVNVNPWEERMAKVAAATSRDDS